MTKWHCDKVTKIQHKVTSSAFASLAVFLGESNGNSISQTHFVSLKSFTMWKILLSCDQSLTWYLDNIETISYWRSSGGFEISHNMQMPSGQLTHIALRTYTKTFCKTSNSATISNIHGFQSGSLNHYGSSIEINKSIS